MRGPSRCGASQQASVTEPLFCLIRFRMATIVDDQGRGEIFQQYLVLNGRAAPGSALARRPNRCKQSGYSTELVFRIPKDSKLMLRTQIANLEATEK